MAKLDKKEYVIGVDGGATKSTAALADLDGNIIKVKRGQSINYHGVGKARAKSHLNALLGGLLKKYSVRAAVLGLAGLNTTRDQRFYNQVVRHTVPRGVRTLVVNDTKIALEAACPGDPARLLIVSGTGSNIYGEHKKKNARAGGWDFLVGDEGAGYEFGMKAIRAAIRSYDGRENKTVLEKLVLKKARARTVPDLINKIYKVWHERPNELKYYIASFSPVVDQAFDRGDSEARNIIKNGAEELYLGARAVIKKLRMEKSRLCVGLAGSNFNAPGLKQQLTRKIKTIAPKAYVVSPVTPVEGAIRLAIRILPKKSSS